MFLVLAMLVHSSLADLGCAVFVEPGWDGSSCDVRRIDVGLLKFLDPASGCVMILFYVMGRASLLSPHSDA